MWARSQVQPLLPLLYPATHQDHFSTVRWYVTNWIFKSDLPSLSQCLAVVAGILIPVKCSHGLSNMYLFRVLAELRVASAMVRLRDAAAAQPKRPRWASRIIRILPPHALEGILQLDSTWLTWLWAMLDGEAESSSACVYTLFTHSGYYVGKAFVC